MNSTDDPKPETGGRSADGSPVHRAQLPGDPTGDQQIHQGYDLETGMLLRVHEWIDLFPWLRLLRVLRVAGSPTFLTLTAIVMSLWFVGVQLILAMTAGVPDQTLFDGQGNVEAVAISASSLWKARVAVVIWSVIVWGPLGMLLARQGALLTAGRSLMSLGSAASLAGRRAPAGWLSAVVPFLCLLPFALAVLLVGGLFAYLPDLPVLQWSGGLIVALIVLPGGLLIFGAIFAVPISWAALVNEREPDPLDSLSRGYEYLFRRPVQFVLYVVLAAVLTSIIGGLAWGVGRVAAELATFGLSIVGAAESLQATTVLIYQFLPYVAMAALAWSLLGGIYLLLRQDAGSQEVEDLWITPTVPRPSLPELPTSS